MFEVVFLCLLVVCVKVDFTECFLLFRGKHVLCVVMKDFKFVISNEDNRLFLIVLEIV